ncbi:cation transporting ATPase C-terminal domain-containing protein [uncultured Sulfitobacter sp.]|uniref:cation transporting ATPase C-terminal domain-containing protein n=1 Tax=uncultured Sulfitobacter sp. TaxID=191468 RepID=UPI0030FAD22F
METYTGLSSLWIFFHLMDLGGELARTTGFTGIEVFEKVSVFAFRSLRPPSWKIGLFSNSFLLLALTVTFGTQVLAMYWPPLLTLLHTVPMGRDEWALIAIFALPILVVPEVFKALGLGLQRT